MSKVKHTTKRGIKFPIMKNVEYVDLIKDGKNIPISGDEVEGMTWREFQLLAGKKVGSGRFSYSLKLKNEDIVHSATVKAVTDNFEVKKSDIDDSKYSLIMNKFEQFEKAITKAQQSGGITVDMLVQQSKFGYENQISFLNQQITFKDGVIVKLESKIDSLEEELDKADETLAQLESKSGWVGMMDSYKPIIVGFLQRAGAKPTVVPTLAGDPNDIPKEVIDILSQIDYVRLKSVPDKYNELLGYLNTYVSILPLKAK